MKKKILDQKNNIKAKEAMIKNKNASNKETEE